MDVALTFMYFGIGLAGIGIGVAGFAFLAAVVSGRCLIYQEFNSTCTGRSLADCNSECIYRKGDTDTRQDKGNTRQNESSDGEI